MAWLRGNLEVLVFLTGPGLLTFLTGMAVGRAGLFPWTVINGGFGLRRRHGVADRPGRLITDVWRISTSAAGWVGAPCS